MGQQAKVSVDYSIARPFNMRLATRFVLSETKRREINPSPLLTDEQAERLKILLNRYEHSNAFLMWQLKSKLTKLASLIAIEGYSWQSVPIDLKTWVVSRVALLPSPFEEFVSPSIWKQNGLYMADREKERLENIYAQLFEKYVKGLLDRSDNQCPKLNDSPFAMKVARWGFFAYLAGLDILYHSLRGTFPTLEDDTAIQGEICMLVDGISNVEKNIGAIICFWNRPRAGRPCLTIASPQLLAVARIVSNNPKVPKSRWQALLMIEEGCSDRTADRWLKTFLNLSENERISLIEQVRSSEEI